MKLYGYFKMHFVLVLTICFLTGYVFSSDLVSSEMIEDDDSEQEAIDRTKRSLQTSPCEDKFRMLKDHSACLSSKSEKLSQSDIDLIVKTHNEFRSQVNPSASNMLRMSWDTETAMIAQRWADKCLMKHDGGVNRVIPGKFSLGQNIAMGAISWKQAMDLWEDEKNKFTFGTSKNFHEVGHYTQIVWADTNKIGCGVAKCGSQNFHVCNYGPAGNVGDYSSPYTQGKSCESCKSQKCDGGKLCDCGLTCLNDGTLDRSSCTCTCRQNYQFYVFNNCSLDCGLVQTDPDVCQSKYGQNSCELIANDCPNKCKFCPYGSFNYTDTDVDKDHNNTQSVDKDHNNAQTPNHFFVLFSLCFIPILATYI